MTNAKPLDLEELWAWFKTKFGSDSLNRYYGYETEELIKEIKQRIKQACKFYLKYMDNPVMFIEDFPEYKEEVEKLYSFGDKIYVYRIFVNNINFENVVDIEDIVKNEEEIRKYNEWLLKLVFDSPDMDKNKKEVSK